MAFCLDLSADTIRGRLEMMYKWSPKDVEILKKAVNVCACETANDSDFRTLKSLNDDLGSILAVMESTNQDFVYIVGRDPNKV